MSTTSPDWGVKLLQNQQRQPNVNHNVAVLMLQAVAIGGAQTITNTPGTLTDGNLYIIGTAPTGAWSGKANKLAYAFGGSWYYLPDVTSSGTNIPIGERHEGLRVWVNDENAEYVWDGAAWIVRGSVGSLVKLTIASDQSLTQNAYTILDFDTNVVAPLAAFYTVSADGRVTVKKAGTYMVTAEVYCENTGGASQNFDIAFFVNGALYFGEESQTPVAAGSKRTILRTAIVTVTAGQIIDVRIWTDGTSSKVETAPTIHGQTPNPSNTLTIVRI